MIKFEKVSFEQFKVDMNKYYPLLPEYELKDRYDRLKLPKRSTSGSAGYDFFSPVNDCLGRDGQYQVIPTCIRFVVENEGKVFLNLVPRSGLGFKFGTDLANTCGIIDQDYYLSQNEGHILVKMGAKIDKAGLEEGKAFVQGIIIPYLTVTDEDKVTEVRDGGFGSTDKAGQ